MGAELHDDLIHDCPSSAFHSTGWKSIARPCSGRKHCCRWGRFSRGYPVREKDLKKLLPCEQRITRSGRVSLAAKYERPEPEMFTLKTSGVEQKLTPWQRPTFANRPDSFISLKHSSHARLGSIFVEPELLTIEVEDDGTGFSKVPEFIASKKNTTTLKMRSTHRSPHCLFARQERLLARSNILSKTSSPGSKNPISIRIGQQGSVFGTPAS